MPRPPSSVLAALLATAVVVSVALGVFAWRLASSESALASEQRTRQLDAETAALAAGLRQQLAETGERLSTWLGRPVSEPPALDHAVVVTWLGGRPSVTPAAALAFLPELPPSRPAPMAFDDAELLEFASPLDAAARYRRWVGDPNVEVRASALLRLARSLRTAERLEPSLDAFHALAGLGDVTLDITGLPAGIVGLHEQAALLDALNRPEDAAKARAEVVAGILAGRWAIDRPNAEAFLAEAGGAPSGTAWALAEATETLWKDGDVRRVPRGRLFRSLDRRSAVATWRSAGPNALMAVAWVDDLLAPLLNDDVAWQLTQDGTVVAGASTAPEFAPPARLVDDDNDVELRSWRAAAAPQAAGPPLIIWLTAAALAFLWAATYFIARAIRREAAVAELQSDFVSAVSHEFRSPLTTIRQMAEMLQANRVTQEDRRHEYYDVLAAEATRLQRLVETLLNLGRIEAGSERYDMRVLDAESIVDRAIEDVRALAESQHHAIERSPPASTVLVRADEDALRLAVRNLLENAIRYSPGQPTVWVGWRDDGGRAAIEVIDHGLGLDADERESVFGKFVRGRAAVASNAKGTGVGLAMVRHVIEAHGGSVDVRSEAGETVFTLWLPLAPAPEAVEVHA